MDEGQRHQIPVFQIDLNQPFIDVDNVEDNGPVFQIDLNQTFIHVDNVEGNGQQEEAQFEVPDLNIGVEDPIFDLNCSPNSPLIEISSSIEPIIEDVSHMHVGIQSQENSGEEIPDTTNENSCRNLRNDERKAIFGMLLQKSVGGKLKHGTTKLVASLFSISMRTVQRIWKHYKNGGIHVDVSHKRTKNCGRKRIQIDLNQLREIPLNQRTTIRSLAHSINVSKSKMYRVLKLGLIRRHSNAIKPFLKEENKISRLRFCISMLEESSIPHDPIFKGMYNIIHIDEKWFYMTKKNEKYYLLPDEEDPLRTCKSKNFIGKVMFLVALARPRFNAIGNEIFSGKIGVFPFITLEPAKRSSVNRAAGTLETKPIASITREVIRSCMIEKVLPAIKDKWPREDLGYPIFIQQDNARTHIAYNDTEFCQAAARDGFDIRLMCQPANSPDLNVLDLGFFSAIQSLQYKEAPKNVDELVNAVVKSFEDFSTRKSNRIFLSLQMCMIEIMKIKGSQKYRTPHMKKSSLERQGRLPTQIKCESELVQEVLNYLSSTT